MYNFVRKTFCSHQNEMPSTADMNENSIGAAKTGPFFQKLVS